MHTSQSDTNAPPPIMLTNPFGVFTDPEGALNAATGLFPEHTKHFTVEPSNTSTNDWNQAFGAVNNALNTFRNNYSDKVPEDKWPEVTSGVGAAVQNVTNTLKANSFTATVDYGVFNPGGQLGTAIIAAAPEFIPNETQVLPFLCNSMCQLSCDAFTDTKDTTYDDLAHLCYKDTYTEQGKTNPYPVCQQRCVNTLSNMPLAKLLAKSDSDVQDAAKLCNKLSVSDIEDNPKCLLPDPCQGFSDFYNITANKPFPACAPLNSTARSLWSKYTCGTTPRTGLTPRPVCKDD